MRAWWLVALLLLAPVAQAAHVDHERISWACGFGGSMQRGHPDDCGIDPVGGEGVGSEGEPEWGEAWIDDDERVLTVVHDGQARAVPIRMLDHHEIVNTQVGSTEVAITYCPLCGSGITFEREVFIKDAEKRLSFAASGFLFNGDLVMWDAQTGTLWNQITGTAIAQLVEGRVQPVHDDVQLTRLPTGITTWKAFQEVHPDALMLQRVRSSYGAVYSGYSNDPDNCAFRVCAAGDELHPKEMVVGAVAQDQAVAFPMFGLQRVGGLAVHGQADRSFVAVLHADGSATVYVSEHRFEAKDGLHQDQDGTMWDLRNGTTVQGDRTLETADTLPLFWFAWLNHYPDSGLWIPENGTQAGALKHDNGRLPGFTIPIVAGLLVLGAVLWRRRSG